MLSISVTSSSYPNDINGHFGVTETKASQMLEEISEPNGSDEEGRSDDVSKSPTRVNVGTKECRVLVVKLNPQLDVHLSKEKGVNVKWLKGLDSSDGNCEKHRDCGSDVSVCGSPPIPPSMGWKPEECTGQSTVRTEGQRRNLWDSTFAYRATCPSNFALADVPATAANKISRPTTPDAIEDLVLQAPVIGNPDSLGNEIAADLERRLRSSCSFAGIAAQRRDILSQVMDEIFFNSSEKDAENPTKVGKRDGEKAGPDPRPPAVGDEAVVAVLDGLLARITEVDDMADSDKYSVSTENQGLVEDDNASNATDFISLKLSPECSDPEDDDGSSPGSSPLSISHSSNDSFPDDISNNDRNKKDYLLDWFDGFKTRMVPTSPSTVMLQEAAEEQKEHNNAESTLPANIQNVADDGKRDLEPQTPDGSRKSVTCTQQNGEEKTEPFDIKKTVGSSDHRCGNDRWFQEEESDSSSRSRSTGSDSPHVQVSAVATDEDGGSGGGGGNDISSVVYAVIKNCDQGSAKLNPILPLLNDRTIPKLILSKSAVEDTTEDVVDKKRIVEQSKVSKVSPLRLSLKGIQEASKAKNVGRLTKKLKRLSIDIDDVNQTSRTAKSPFLERKDSLTELRRSASTEAAEDVNGSESSRSPTLLIYTTVDDKNVIETVNCRKEEKADESVETVSGKEMVEGEEIKVDVPRNSKWRLIDDIPTSAITMDMLDAMADEISRTFHFDLDDSASFKASARRLLLRAKKSNLSRQKRKRCSKGIESENGKRVKDDDDENSNLQPEEVNESRKEVDADKEEICGDNGTVDKEETRQDETSVPDDKVVNATSGNENEATLLLDGKSNRSDENYDNQSLNLDVDSSLDQRQSPPPIRNDDNLVDQSKSIDEDSNSNAMNDNVDYDDDDGDGDSDEEVDDDVDYVSQQRTAGKSDKKFSDLEGMLKRMRTLRKRGGADIVNVDFNNPIPLEYKRRRRKRQLADRKRTANGCRRFTGLEEDEDLESAPNSPATTTTTTTAASSPSSPAVVSNNSESETAEEEEEEDKPPPRKNPKRKCSEKPFQPYCNQICSPDGHSHDSNIVTEDNLKDKVSDIVCSVQETQTDEVPLDLTKKFEIPVEEGPQSRQTPDGKNSRETELTDTESTEPVSSVDVHPLTQTDNIIDISDSPLPKIASVVSSVETKQVSEKTSDSEPDIIVLNPACKKPDQPLSPPPALLREPTPPVKQSDRNLIAKDVPVKGLHEFPFLPMDSERFHAEYKKLRQELAALDMVAMQKERERNTILRLKRYKQAVMHQLQLKKVLMSRDPGTGQFDDNQRQEGLPQLLPPVSNVAPIGIPGSPVLSHQERTFHPLKPRPVQPGGPPQCHLPITSTEVSSGGPTMSLTAPRMSVAIPKPIPANLLPASVPRLTTGLTAPGIHSASAFVPTSGMTTNPPDSISSLPNTISSVIPMQFSDSNSMGLMKRSAFMTPTSVPDWQKQRHPVAGVTHTDITAGLSSVETIVAKANSNFGIPGCWIDDGQGSLIPIFRPVNSLGGPIRFSAVFDPLKRFPPLESNYSGAVNHLPTRMESATQSTQNNQQVLRASSTSTCYPPPLLPSNDINTFATSITTTSATTATAMPDCYRNSTLARLLMASTARGQASKEQASSSSKPNVPVTTTAALTNPIRRRDDISSLVKDKKFVSRCWPTCQNCHNSMARYICAGCNRQWYCSEKCQILDWKKHFKTCRPTQQK